jgi:REP element-mobilizing transposase RayT
MSRGNRKSPIFTDDRDRHRFLQLLEHALERYAALCYGYNLMGNHYHAILCTPRDNISDVMRQVNGRFTQYVNWRNGWTGHLLEARFTSIVIGDDHYLRNALAYVAMNPVEAGLVDDPAGWKWSSYPAVLGRRPAPRFLDTSWLTDLFPAPSLAASRRCFRDFVVQSTLETGEEVVWGGAAARQAVRSVIGTQLYRLNVPRSFRALGRLSLADLFKGVMRRDRRRVILRAHVVHGYRMTEIARYLDLHPSTISKIVNHSGTYRRLDH